MLLLTILYVDKPCVDFVTAVSKKKNDGVKVGLRKQHENRRDWRFSLRIIVIDSD